MAGSLVLPDTGVGVIEQSTTRKPRIPCTPHRSSMTEFRELGPHGTGAGARRALVTVKVHQRFYGDFYDEFYFFNFLQ